MRASDIQPGQRFTLATEPGEVLLKVNGPGCFAMNGKYDINAVHPDASCELVGAESGKPVTGALKFNITHHESDKSLAGRIEITEHRIDVFFDSYGTHGMNPGYGSPVLIEVGDNGEPVVYCWAEIDSEDFTHKISLAHARDTREPVRT